MAALAVLEAIVPESLVLLAIRPPVDAEALFLIVGVLALVRAAIRPLINASAMELTVLVQASVFSLVRCNELAVPAHLISLPISAIHGLVEPLVPAETMLAALIEVAFEDRAVTEFLPANSVLHVVDPAANVALLVLVVDVLAVPVSLVIQELTIISIAIGMHEFSISVGFSVAYVSGIRSTIRPPKSTMAMRNKTKVRARAT